MSLNTEYKNIYAFGYISPNYKCSPSKGNVAVKVLGYIPLVGTFVGIGRAYNTISSHGGRGFTARHLTRSLIEFTSFGSVLIIPDVAISVFRHFSKEKDKVAHSQDQQVLEVLEEAASVFNKAEGNIPDLRLHASTLFNPYDELKRSLEDLKTFSSKTPGYKNKETTRARQTKRNKLICDADNKRIGMRNAVVDEIRNEAKKGNNRVNEKLTSLQKFYEEVGNLEKKLMDCQTTVL